MASISSSNTQTAVISTEHTLATITTAGIYRAFIDCDNLVNGEEVEFRWYSKVLNAGSEKVVFSTAAADDLGSTPIIATDTIECPSGGQIHLTLKQTSGTGRNFDWSIRLLDDSSVTVSDKTGFRLSATGVDDVWDETTSGHSTVGTTGKALTDAGSAGDPWSTALPGSYSSGQAGKIVGDNVNATISSRLASASITLNTGAVTVDDKTGFRLSATGVDDIWDEATSGHSTSGTTGKALTDAGSAGDPWAIALPGSYSSGQAGKIVGDNINATISSRLASASITLSSGAVTLTTAERDSVAAALLDLTGSVETGITLRKLLRGLSAFLFGETTGGGSTTVTFRNFNDSKDVIIFTLDNTDDTNRTAVTTDLT